MAHYKSFFDNKFIGAWDLPPGRDVVLTIERVSGEEIKGPDNKTDKRPVIYFVGTSSGKGFVCNKTNAKTIARLYGADTANWKGQRVALYATTTQAFGETHECIRVRPKVPPAPRRKGPDAPATPEPAALPPGREDVPDAEIEEAEREEVA